MVRKFRHSFNKIFDRLASTDRLIFRSCGLISLAKFMQGSGCLALMARRLHDSRHTAKVHFPLVDIVMQIILQIIDGNKRISHFSRSPNLALFHEMFRGNVPHPTAILRALKANRLLNVALAKILLRYSMNTLTEHCRKTGAKTIVVDMDLSGREIHGKQENVSKGYFALKPKNTKGFQFRLWTVRGLKIILKADLLPGSTHSQKGVIPDFRLILRTLKKAGIIGVFVGDSGFFSAEICNLIQDYGHEFIFALPQHKTVRKRGKNAKHKRVRFAGQIVFKEGFRPTDKNNPHDFREIFVKVLSNDGQLWFDFAADQFTNVLITNKKLAAENIYKLYRGHAVVETIIEELKNDFGTGLAHAAQFHVNAAMTVVTALAYNIKNGFIDAHHIQRGAGIRMKLATLQAQWLHLPGVLTRSGNRRVLHLPQTAHARFAALEKAA